MELKRRLGQLFIIGFQGQELLPGSRLEDDLSEGNLGGIILFDRCLAHPGTPGNIGSPQQVRKLVSDLQRAAATPLLIGVDQEGGLVRRFHAGNGFSACASAEEMGAAVPGYTAAQAGQTARMLAAVGVNINFAPVVDLNLNRFNPIIGKVRRSFSADPETVCRHAEAWINAHREQRILTCLKHFPGHGSAAADSHLGFVDISASWQEAELTPYRRLISLGLADTIMVGHLFNQALDPDLPATLSPAIVTGLLRRELGYDGVIITDDMQMKAISDRYGFGEALCLAFAAGVDMVVIGNNLEHNATARRDAVAAVWGGVRQKIVPETRLLAALGRVERLKKHLQGTNG